MLKEGWATVSHALPQRTLGLQLNQSPNESPSHYQPIREKSYTLGQSYDTASGRVVTMMTKNTAVDRFDFTMTTTRVDKVVSMESGRRVKEQVKIIPLSSMDDVITGGHLITIEEVKTPTSPSDPPSAEHTTAAEVICVPTSVTHEYDNTGGFISGRTSSIEETGRGGARTLDFLGDRESGISPLTPISPFTPLSPLSPFLPPKSPSDEWHLTLAPPLGHLSGRTSPSMARVVRQSVCLIGWLVVAWKPSMGSKSKRSYEMSALLTPPPPAVLFRPDTETGSVAEH